MRYKNMVIVRYHPSGEEFKFEGDSISSFTNGALEIFKGGKATGYAGQVRGRMPSHAYIIKEKVKKWKIKLIKE